MVLEDEYRVIFFVSLVSEGVACRVLSNSTSLSPMYATGYQSNPSVFADAQTPSLIRVKDSHTSHSDHILRFACGRASNQSLMDFLVTPLGLVYPDACYHKFMASGTKFVRSNSGLGLLDPDDATIAT